MNCSNYLNKDTPATSHLGETKQEYFAPIREDTPTETEYLEQEERITPLQVYTHPDMISKSSMLNNKIWALIEHVPRDDSDFWKATQVVINAYTVHPNTTLLEITADEYFLLLFDLYEWRWREAIMKLRLGWKFTYNTKGHYKIEPVKYVTESPFMHNFPTTNSPKITYWDIFPDGESDATKYAKRRGIPTHLEDFVYCWGEEDRTLLKNHPKWALEGLIEHIILITEEMSGITMNQFLNTSAKFRTQATWLSELYQYSDFNPTESVESEENNVQAKWGYFCSQLAYHRSAHISDTGPEYSSDPAGDGPISKQIKKIWKKLRNNLCPDWFSCSSTRHWGCVDKNAIQIFVSSDYRTPFFSKYTWVRDTFKLQNISLADYLDRDTKMKGARLFDVLYGDKKIVQKKAKVYQRAKQRYETIVGHTSLIVSRTMQKIVFWLKNGGKSKYLQHRKKHFMGATCQKFRPWDNDCAKMLFDRNMQNCESNELTLLSGCLDSIVYEYYNKHHVHRVRDIHNSPIHVITHSKRLNNVHMELLIKIHNFPVPDQYWIFRETAVSKYDASFEKWQKKRTAQIVSNLYNSRLRDPFFHPPTRIWDAEEKGIPIPVRIKNYYCMSEHVSKSTCKKTLTGPEYSSDPAGDGPWWYWEDPPGGQDPYYESEPYGWDILHPKDKTRDQWTIQKKMLPYIIPLTLAQCGRGMEASSPYKPYVRMIFALFKYPDMLAHCSCKNYSGVIHFYTHEITVYPPDDSNVSKVILRAYPGGKLASYVESSSVKVSTKKNIMCQKTHAAYIKCIRDLLQKQRIILLRTLLNLEKKENGKKVVNGNFPDTMINHIITFL